MSANEKIMLAVVSSCVTSPFLRVIRCSGLVRSTSVYDPRPEAAGGVEILALGDVELAVPRPVADGALVAQRDAGDHVKRAVLGTCLQSRPITMAISPS